MSRRIVSLTFGSVLALGLGACGSDKKDGGGFQAGVDGSTSLGTLTPAQQVTICSNQASYVHAQVDTTSLMRFVCAFTPQVFLAASDADCETAMDSCVMALSVKVDVNVPTSDIKTVCSTIPLSQCQGTVADYQNCVDSIANVQLNFGTDFSCGKRTQYMNGPTVGVNACAAVGPSCSAVNQPADIR
jgi:hypothetical protein